MRPKKVYMVAPIGRKSLLKTWVSYFFNGKSNPAGDALACPLPQGKVAPTSRLPVGLGSRKARWRCKSVPCDGDVGKPSPFLPLVLAGSEAMGFAEDTALCCVQGYC